MATFCVSARSLLRAKHLDFIKRPSLRWAAADAKTPAQGSDIPAQDAKTLAQEWAEAKPYDSIPSLRMLPFLGTNWLFLPIIGKFKPHELYAANLYKHRLLGEIIRDKFGPLNLLVITNPNEIMKAFQRSEKMPVRGVLKALQTYRESRGDLFPKLGLLVTDDDEWWTLRKKVQHLMDPTTFDPYLDPLQDVANELVQKIYNERDRSGEMPDFLGELYKWALESVGVVALDTRLGCLHPDLSPDSEPKKMINIVKTMFECMNKLEGGTGNVGIWKYLPSPTWKKFVRVSDQFSEIAFKYIDRAFKALNDGTAGSMTGGKLTTLQSMLQNQDVGLGNVLVTVADMLMAGIETTAHTAGFFLYNIARFPEQQEILYQEIKKRIPGKMDRITEHKFTYLSCCFSESLRLMPTVGGITRVMKEDIVLCGYRVPKGTVVASNNHIMGMDERLFRNAKEFKPERWMEDKPHRATQTHFGFGKRACIGRQLAEMEVFCLVTMILRHFKIEYHYEDIGISTRMVNAPDRPLRLTFIKREDDE